MSSHGLHRWQQGFRLRELTREWGHLQRCLMNVVEGYSGLHPEIDSDVVAIALSTWSQLCMTGVSDSAEQFWKLQQAEAGGHIQDLEQALAAVDEIEKVRATEWHQAAHDLRGGLSVVTMTTTLLGHEELEEERRLESTAILQRSVISLQDMLNNLISLARLGAGHEQRSVAPFDAASLLHNFCALMMPVAQAQGLYLRGEGPNSLAVVGDSTKVQRILQKLVLNAIKYTDRGGIVLTWEMSREKDVSRWMISVQDTGPGLPAESNRPVAARLLEATEKTHEVEDHAAASGTSSNGDDHAQTLSSQSLKSSLRQQAGEGIGLSIVKGLCDLLDATLEVESSIGQGTTFRVTFPVSYPC
jgi:signal transduction histidine kinase